MTTATRKLMDIGEALGADPVAYFKIRTFFEDLERFSEDSNSPYQEKACEILNALDLIASIVQDAQKL